MTSALVSPQPGWYADTDEVAAILESSGINDRVAGRDYGHTSVFALAGEIYARAVGVEPTPAETSLRTGPATGTRPVADALIRAGLYLTPTAIAIGAAPLTSELPWYATTGLLVLGWGASQGLAYLGYGAVNEAGLPAAARRLAGGFALLGAFCLAPLAAGHAEPRAFLAGAAQLMLFTAITGALVTGAERRTLLVALGCWVAVAAMVAGFTGPAVLILFVSLLAMLVVAYRPAWRRDRSRWRPQLRQWVTALGHGVVGAGQAVLFVLVVLQPALPAGLSGDLSGGLSGGLDDMPSAVLVAMPSPAPSLLQALSLLLPALPLLVGVPLTELMLLWHHRRVARGRARLAEVEAFRRHLGRVGWGSGIALAAPLLTGGALVLHLLRAPTATGWAIAASLLLAGVNALCLVLVAHRRPGIAACMVWSLAALIVAGALIMSGLQPGSPEAAVRACAVILLCAYPPVLLLAVRAMTDARSYQ